LLHERVTAKIWVLYLLTNLLLYCGKYARKNNKVKFLNYIVSGGDT
jgi:hypothetical protein